MPKAEPEYREVEVTIRFNPLAFKHAKDLVDNAFIGMPGIPAHYAREILTMIEHDALEKFGKAYVESWQDHPSPMPLS
tara:strand:+ start:407 stop:640 length:234 start_codon:yes stop_codon:yes gene_type:complete